MWASLGGAEDWELAAISTAASLQSPTRLCALPPYSATPKAGRGSGMGGSTPASTGGRVKKIGRPSAATSVFRSDNGAATKGG